MKKKSQNKNKKIVRPKNSLNLTCESCGKKYNNKIWYDKHIKICKKSKDLRYGALYQKGVYDKIFKLVSEDYITTNGLKDIFKTNWVTMNRYLLNHPELIDLMNKQRDIIITKAQDNIYNAIHNGDVKTSKWFLAKMKTEYSDKIKVDANVEGSITINVISDNKNIDKI